MTQLHTTVRLDLGPHSYPIHIGAGLLTEGLLIAEHLRGSRVVVVSNDCVAPLYMQRIIDMLPAAVEVDQFLVPDGEAAKSLANYSAMLDFLLTRRHNRTTTIIALGGGVVGDLAGFVAASYCRGVGFIQVPTTLLAQVDSSVGGKTAINHELGKNMIGAFYQPQVVLIDTDTLDTLPEREYLSGLAEVLKYAVIGSPGLFAFLERERTALLRREPGALREIIEESCRAKAAVVVADEREQGVRATLNFGHTFGHALEKQAGYGTLLHGEAVSIGMVLAADLGVRLGVLEADEAGRIKRLIGDYGLPVDPPVELIANEDEFIVAMTLDKKAVDGRMRFVVPTKIGAVELCEVTDSALLRATLRHE